MQDILFHIYVCLYMLSYKLRYFHSLKHSLLYKNWSFKRTEIIAQKIFSCWIFQLCLELCSSAFRDINSVCHHPPSLKEQSYTKKNRLTFPEASAQFFLWITVMVPLMPKAQGVPYHPIQHLWQRQNPVNSLTQEQDPAGSFTWLNQNSVKSSLKRELWRTLV